MLDTKLKSNKMSRIAGFVISFLLLSAVSAGVMAFYPVYLKNANFLLEQAKEQDEKNEAEAAEVYKDDYMKQLYRGNYSLYLDMMKQVNTTEITPKDVFLPYTMRNIDEDIESGYENEDASDAESEELADREEFIGSFDLLINDWSNTFFNTTIGSYGLEYYIIDNNTGKTMTNTINPLNLITESTEEAQKTKDLYSFYAVFEYDKEGKLQIPQFYGLNENKKDTYQTLELTRDLIKNEMDNNWPQYFNQIQAPSDVTIIYAAKADTFYIPEGRELVSGNQWRQSWSFLNGGFLYAYFIALAIITLMALLLPFNKFLSLGLGKEGKVPLEIGLAGIAAVLSALDALVPMAFETVSGTFLDFSDYSLFPVWLKKVLDYGANYIIWMIVFGIWFVAVLSMRPVFTLGIKRYLKERTLTGRFIVWVFRNIKKFFTSLSDIDLTDSSNKAILKILAVNFVILMLLCSIWLVGVAVLIPYTIILFFIMKKYLADIKQKYGVLLNATSSMAEGNLEVSIEEDLGIFNPLKEELAKLQIGFKKAVEEEIKSQKMKTELITNVSHDLKTPLTAIITYVNLLKDSNITEEERDSYIDTLDKKSLRLKRLIEDLFEISKASSNTMTLNLVDVDLVSLIKQVQLELMDKIEEAQVEFRYQLTDDKVILNLDSEKTYRIFENLFLNITKYAMPQTRAYIEVQDGAEDVIVTIKNISATELNFTPTEISERFVRGDKSRNTEGSGLGLAIVKNFVELQNGKFQIQLDGDLFKVVIIWKK